MPVTLKNSISPFRIFSTGNRAPNKKTNNLWKTVASRSLARLEYEQEIKDKNCFKKEVLENVDDHERHPEAQNVNITVRPASNITNTNAQIQSDIFQTGRRKIENTHLDIENNGVYFEEDNNKNKGQWPNEKNKKEDKRSNFIVAAMYEFLGKELTVGGMRYVFTHNGSYFRRVVWLLLVTLGFIFMMYQFSDSHIYAFLGKELTVGRMRYVCIHNGSYFRRLVWLLLVTLGFIFMMFQFYDRIKYFAQNPTSVNIKMNQREKIDFPTVTICNENIIHRDRAAAIPELPKLVAEMYPPWPNPSFKPNFEAAKEIFQHMEQDLNLTWDNTWFFLSPMFGKAALIDCKFDGGKCDKNHFNIVATDMGHCLQFNGENFNFSSTRAGSTYGLSVILNTEQTKYLYVNSRAVGFRVMLHTKNDVPKVNELGFKASVGQVSSTAMQYRTVTQLPKPFGNCSDTEGYLFKKCADSCLHKYVIKECGCRYYYFNDSDVRACDPAEMYECADNVSSTYLTEQLQNKICECPPQCVTHQYKHTLTASSISNLATEGIANLMCVPIYNRSCSFWELEGLKASIKNDLCEIEIYFDELVHEEIATERAYTILALLCDIGGALGLILGSTVLTLFEVLDFIIVLLHKTLYRR